MIHGFQFVKIYFGPPYDHYLIFNDNVHHNLLVLNHSCSANVNFSNSTLTEHE